MKTDKLGWDWFDPIQCWETLYKERKEGGIKRKLTHTSCIKGVTSFHAPCSFPREEREDEDRHKSEQGQNEEEERFYPQFPYNAELRLRLKQ